MSESPIADFKASVTVMVALGYLVRRGLDTVDIEGDVEGKVNGYDANILA